MSATFSSRAEEIVNTALDVAESRGVSGVTTAALARRLGFTEAALYRYFPGKVGILVGALQHLSERLLATMLLELMPEAVAGPAAVEAQLVRHVERFTYRQGLLLELILHASSARSEPLREAGHAFMHEYSHRMVVYFQQLQRGGLINTATNADELGRLWSCQLLGGFLGCRLARDSWRPTAQAGFASFIRQIRDEQTVASAP
jgi:AcrR family transcriptional regulator